LEIVLFVIEIRMFPPQIVLNPAAAEVWSGKGVGDRALFGDDANVFGSIDKDTIAREQFVHLIQRWPELIEKIAQHRNEFLRQIANLSADTGVGSCEPCAAEQLAQVVNFFPLGKGIKKNGHRPENERHRADSHQM